MQDQSTKKCCTCKQEKSFSEFHRNKSLSDGYTRRCKACVSDFRMSAYRRIEVPSPETVIDGHKRCRRCYEVRPLTDFYRVSDLRIRQGGHKDGLSYNCKRCQFK